MSVGGWANVMHVLKASEKLLEDTLRGDAGSVADSYDKNKENKPHSCLIERLVKQ